MSRLVCIVHCILFAYCMCYPHYSLSSWLSCISLSTISDATSSGCSFLPTFLSIDSSTSSRLFLISDSNNLLPTPLTFKSRVEAGLCGLCLCQEDNGAGSDLVGFCGTLFHGRADDPSGEVAVYSVAMFAP